MNYLDFCIDPLRDPLVQQLAHRLDKPAHILREDLEVRLKKHYYETEKMGITPNIVDLQHVIDSWEKYWKRKAK